MKWFHHECSARHDPKLQMLGATHGAEGIGIYWGLLEEIGQDSDTFHLKVIGISEKADKKFADFLQNPEKSPEQSLGDSIMLAKVPKLPMKLLAKNLYTSPKKLHAVINFCMEVNLFDTRKWLEFNVLYSPSFEQRADDYTRRVRRCSDNVRTNPEQSTNRLRISSEVSAESVRTLSVSATDNVRLETDTEQKKNICNTRNVDNSNVDNSYIIEPTEVLFDDYCIRFHSTLQHWNHKNSNKLDWNPNIRDLKKLFYGGEYERKLAMCFHAYKILGEKINYPELVMRALNLLLNKCEKSNVSNPFGWLWTCLHGNGNGKTAWVQLLTADEERPV
jgi:hypothetical protein